MQVSNAVEQSLVAKAEHIANLRTEIALLRQRVISAERTPLEGINDFTPWAELAAGRLVCLSLFVPALANVLAAH